MRLDYASYRLNSLDEARDPPPEFLLAAKISAARCRTLGFGSRSEASLRNGCAGAPRPRRKACERREPLSLASERMAPRMRSPSALKAGFFRIASPAAASPSDQRRASK